MKHVFCSALVLALVLGLAQLFAAPQKKEARVTQVIKDVRLLATKGSPRAASVNDNVSEGTAVRTGADSRAELTFTDQSLARLGANTVFSFSEGAREYDLSSGAILLAVPKNVGAARINTAVATAAVTGFTALYETHRDLSKFMILEGHGAVTIKSVQTEPCELGPGDMIIIPRHPVRCPEILHFDIHKVVKSAKLITQFPPLPPWALNAILKEADNQEGNPPPGGYTDPTGVDKRDQDAATVPIPTPPVIIRPPSSPPPGSR